jgi:hypothetical protein
LLSSQLSSRTSSRHAWSLRAARSSPVAITWTLIAFVLCACDALAGPASDDAQLEPPEPASAEPSVKLAALIGQLAQPAPDRDRVGLYGTDLGWSFQHGDQLRVLFGDSWRGADGALIGDQSDDSEGFISLRDFPDGDAVERHAATSAFGRAPFMGAGPELHVRADAQGKVAPIALYPRSLDTAALRMSIGQVPIAGFSNGQDAFAIFHRGAPLACASDADGRSSCPDRFSCDQGLGVCASATQGGYQRPCVLGGDECECVPVQGGGLCQDRESSQYRADLAVGREWSVVLQHEVGVEVGAATYVTQPWATNRFMNAVAKSVRDFEPTRRDLRANDYRPVTSASARAKVLLWGRPNFVGIASAGLDAKLYFAYADMPHADAAGSFDWTPHYFTGLDQHARPRFSDDASDAAPLALDGAGLTREQVDFVNQMGIAYLAPLGRWAMFYGGGAPSKVDFSVTLPDGTRPVHDPRNAIVARYAEQPWGPWSAPVEVLAAGDPMNAEPSADSEFASGGLLHHEACRTSGCAPGEHTSLYEQTPWGFFYAPLIVDAWTEARASNSADVYWFLSTWSPYQVVLMKTRLAQR